MGEVAKINRRTAGTGKPQPAYRQILDTLRSRISKGAYPVGARMPTDEALMSEFGVCRYTARAAVQVLVDDDVVRRFRRKGSFVVATPETSGQWALNSLEDLIEHSFAHKVRVRGKGFVSAGDAPEAAKALRLSTGDQVFRLVVVREGNDAPYTYSEIFIPLEVASRLPTRGLAGVLSSAVIRMIEQHGGVQAVRALQVASAAPAGPEIARALDLPEGAPLLLLERTYTSRDGRALQFARVFCRPDRYRQTVEFRRRQAGTIQEEAPPKRRKSPS
jgi:GntR family transcriptional regulator